MKVESLNRGGLVFAMAWVSFFGASPSFAITKDLLTQEHAPGEIIVRYRNRPSGMSAQSFVFSQMLRTLGSDSVLAVRPFQTDSRMHVVKLAKDEDMKAAIAGLKASPEVELAEPNFVIHAFNDGIPNDPDFLKSWGMRNIGQPDVSGITGLAGADIGVLPLWQKGITGSSKVLVAVIDTGIDWTHPDLAANIYTNPAEVNGAPDKDNDGNGFVHDVHGWNFSANNADSRDDNGHGSHCAGTIGAAGNNGIGIAGVNWNVSLLPVKFMDAAGSGNAAGAIEAINYARLMKANVASNSWGSGTVSEGIRQAIEETKNAGMIFVAAAGNDGNNNDGEPTYPAAYDSDNVIAVAALDHFDQIANFSNYGNRSVHLAAPGVDIYSTSMNGGYQVLSGTSMACPFVAGISALLLSAHPEWSYSEIKSRLIRTSVPVASLTHKVLARGRVNAANAFNNTVPPSLAPAESAWITLPSVIESDHPYYGSNPGVTYTAHVDGAKMIRVHFEKIDTLPYTGHVVLEGRSGVIGDLSGSITDFTSDYSESDTLTIRLFSYFDSQGYGFRIDKIQYIPN